MDGNPADVPIVAPVGWRAHLLLPTANHADPKHAPCGQTRTGHPGALVTIGRGDRVELDPADTLTALRPPPLRSGLVLPRSHRSDVAHS